MRLSLLLQHLPCARAGLLDQGGDQHRLGQVVPVAARHLAQHGLLLQARRVEGAGVIGQPQGLARVGWRGIAAARTGRQAQRMAVPVRAALRREDGPVHVGKALAEEGRCRAHDVVLGLEPGNVQIGLVRPLRRPKAHKGVHLVDLARDGAGQGLDGAPVRIQRIQPQFGPGLHARQPAVA